MSEPRSDPRRRRLLASGLALVALLAAGAFAPRHPDYDFLFGVEAFRPLGLVPFAAAVLVVLLVLANANVSARLSTALGRAGRIPFGRPLLVALAGAAFLFLTNVRLSGDAMTVVLSAALGRVHVSNALTSDLHLLVDALPGLTAYDGVRLVSVASGIVYVPCAIGLARECFRDGPRRAAMATLLLTAGPVVLFFGTIEVYAPLTAALAAYLLVGIRHLRGHGRGLLPPIVAGLAFGLHGSAGLLLPSLILLANDGRLRPWRVKRWALWGLLFASPVVVVYAIVYLGTWGGSAPEDAALRYGSFLGGMGQGPLLPLLRSPANLTHRYALLDVEHLVGVLNLWVLASPVGLALLLIGRPGRGGTVFRWVAVVAAFLVLFPVFWNVNYPLRRDWDLFSPMGVPIALLGGMAFLRLGGGRRRAVGVAAMALLTFVPLVIGNLGDRPLRWRYARTMAEAFGIAGQQGRGERASENRRAGEVWTRRAARLDRTSPDLERVRAFSKEKRWKEAEAACRRVLEVEPEHPTALTWLGMALYETGRHEAGKATMERAIRADPDDLLSRWNLAMAHVEEGRDDEAIEHLERAVRYGSLDPEVIKVLRLLETFWLMRGDPERAATMERLARRRLELRRTRGR